MATFRAVKGMNDILPDESGRWRILEDRFRSVLERHGFREVRTPLVESTSLFTRSIGDTTDIVEKEMYTFARNDDSLTLRPEGTAGVVRAFVEHKAHALEPVSKWFYLGAMFRAERPQRGRYRQFHQIGGEVFGDPGPAIDAELIDLLAGFLAELGIPDLEVLVNSIGGPESRSQYKAALVDYFTPLSSQLSEESQRRLVSNPLRILDSKDPRDKEAAKGAPEVGDHLTEVDRTHFTGLKDLLTKLGVTYRVDPHLVRGLDYYTRTIFEIKGAKAILGAGDTLLGGGRYDGMVKEIGGPDMPAIGFGAGLERLLLAMGEAPKAPRAEVFVATLEGALADGMILAKELRKEGMLVEMDLRGSSLKSQMRRADNLGVRFAVLVGGSELERGVVQVKELAAHTQEEIARGEVTLAMKRRLRGAA